MELVRAAGPARSTAEREGGERRAPPPPPARICGHGEAPRRRWPGPARHGQRERRGQGLRCVAEAALLHCVAEAALRPRGAVPPARGHRGSTARSREAPAARAPAPAAGAKLACEGQIWRRGGREEGRQRRSASRRRR